MNASLLVERLKAQAHLCERIARATTSEQIAGRFTLIARECADPAVLVMTAHALPQRSLH